MSKRVLIVDDEEDTREIAQVALTMTTDWTILLVASGQEALDLAITQPPDVILLDLMMPDMDGRMTLQHLQANAATQTIPVILVTAKAQPSDRSSFADLKISSLIAKPYRPLELADQIRAALKW